MDANFPHRDLPKFPVALPRPMPGNYGEKPLRCLKKAVIEEFLPRFGYGSEVLYVGDAADKYLVRDDARLKALDFFELSHGELPDIVAYSTQRRWLYLIEAVYSSGPVSPIRHLELSRLTARCNADIVYVTAFLNREAFRKFAADISWETEVWIADAPDHLIHFNGHSFMGPHNPKHQ
jgi:type II restriction enzyme